MFTLLLADEDEVGKGEWGGVKAGKRKIGTLAYADDIALVAEEEEEEMKAMIGNLEKYLVKKKLELNTKKTKIIRCEGGRKMEKDELEVEGRSGRGSKRI